MRTETEQQAVTVGEWNELLGITWGEKLVEYFRVFHGEEPWRLSPANDEVRARAQKALSDIGIVGKVKVISVRRTKHVLDGFEFQLAEHLGMRLHWDDLDRTSLQAGLSARIGDLLHRNVCQRGLQTKIKNAFAPHMSAEWLDPFLQRTFSCVTDSIFTCLRGSPWGTVAYLSVETLDVVGRCLIGLVASGTDEMTKKAAAIMNLFAFGNPLVDEFSTDFYPLLEE